MVMNRNPDWVLKPGPYLDKVTFRVVTADEQRVDTFTTGGADGFYSTNAGSISSARSKVKDSTFTGVTLFTGQTYVFNTSIAPFNDVRVRTAFVQGWDRSIIAKDILGGADVADNFTVQGTPYYDEKAVLPKYDPAAAQKLIDAYIAEKNGGQPLKIAMQNSQSSSDVARAKFIQTSIGQLKNVTVELTTVDTPTLIANVTGAKYQVSSWGFPTLDPEPGLYNAARSGLATNYSKYSNPDVDKNLDAARALTDVAERKKLYDPVWQALAKDLPYFPYVITRQGFVLSSKVQGAKLYTDGVLRYDLLWIKK